MTKIKVLEALLFTKIGRDEEGVRTGHELTPSAYEVRQAAAPQDVRLFNSRVQVGCCKLWTTLWNDCCKAVNRMGNSLLHSALSGGHVEMAVWLAARGASPDNPNACGSTAVSALVSYVTPPQC